MSIPTSLHGTGGGWPRFAHIAFAVDSVDQARTYVLSRGGAAVGDVVTVAISATARVTRCYVRDPEGNIIELQTRASRSG